MYDSIICGCSDAYDYQKYKKSLLFSGDRFFYYHLSDLLDHRGCRATMDVRGEIYFPTEEYFGRSSVKGGKERKKRKRKEEKK